MWLHGSPTWNGFQRTKKLTQSFPAAIQSKFTVYSKGRNHILSERTTLWSRYDQLHSTLTWGLGLILGQQGTRFRIDRSNNYSKSVHRSHSVDLVQVWLKSDMFWCSLTTKGRCDVLVEIARECASHNTKWRPGDAKWTLSSPPAIRSKFTI